MGCLVALTAWRQFGVDPIPNTRSNVVWFALQIAPLLLVLPGVLRRHANALFFATVVSFLYLVHGAWVVMAANDDLRVLGSVEIFFSLAFFCAICMVMRETKAAA